MYSRGSLEESPDGRTLCQLPIGITSPNLCSHADIWTCAEAHEWHAVRKTRLNGEFAVHLERLTVHGDAPAPAQVADHVPVHGGVVGAARFRI